MSEINRCDEPREAGLRKEKSFARETPGFTQVRTARALASVIAIMGMMLLFIQRVLSAVLDMANEALDLAFARYSNFTGRFAAENFAEDKKLLALLKEVRDIMPTADTAVTVLLVCSVILLVVAILGLALPKQFSHVLVALKVLKWNNSPEEDSQSSIADMVSNLGNVPLKKLIIPVVVVIALLATVIGLVSHFNETEQASYQAAIEEMQGHALDYVTAQRDYFAKNQKIGGPKALQQQDSISSKFFTYKVTGSRFIATTVKPMGECPAGSRWTVSSSTKGFFTLELVLSRIQPKDTTCSRLTPEFNQIGRKKKNPTEAR